MSQPAPKATIWQYLLIATVVFLGFNMFFGPKPSDPRKPEEIMADIHKQYDSIKSRAAQEHRSVRDIITELDNGSTAKSGRIDLQTPFDTFSADQDLEQMRLMDDLVLDQSLAGVESVYVSKVDANGGLPKEDKSDRKILASLIVADAQLKAAAERQDITRISLASDRVLYIQRYHGAEPVWTMPVQVAAHPIFARTQITAQSLTREVNHYSQDIGKNTLVWNFFPGYQLVDFLVHVTGAVPSFSYWFGALMLAIFVRGVIWPLSQRQMMWSRQMSQLTPLVNEIREQYKAKTKPEQQQEMQKKIMGLYQEYGMNPMAGCVPALLQFPLFLIVYQSMLHYRFNFQNGFFAWINPSTAASTHGFIAANLGQKDYILIVIYGISMLSTALLAPVSDPTNMRQQRLMGILFAGMFGIMMFFWPVPSAFILYWVFTNILATAQSLRAYRLPLPPLVKKNTPSGGVYPVTGRPGISKDGLPSSTAPIKLNGKPKSTGAPKIHKPKKKR